MCVPVEIEARLDKKSGGAADMSSAARNVNTPSCEISKHLVTSPFRESPNARFSGGASRTWDISPPLCKVLMGLKIRILRLSPGETPASRPRAFLIWGIREFGAGDGNPTHDIQLGNTIIREDECAGCIRSTVARSHKLRQKCRNFGRTPVSPAIGRLRLMGQNAVISVVSRLYRRMALILAGVQYRIRNMCC